ncbi:regulatory protein MarR [Flavobacterium saliperosum S13]|uniref:DNA-binding transcriptional regulator, MarR family n=2 Tax=Flavobacterium saliperosum TaxID=329186 RepID=A0A1G4W2Q5_9FLAO|nr:MarR family transcriptional regulator [Flavobacterium saliperosum]ESU26094.1 regulatory protein MarR [Flavobacterium saliperosum S13]SCX15734.1 DNA-binding transcriptional regulator, MarR family [Flavobacterium saliperosum]
MEKLNNIIFYNIDHSIRLYRMFAQKKLREHGFKITIDQWLVIKCILENPTITQHDLSELVFKDNASVTRIIDLLIKANYLEKEINPDDRRKFMLHVTKEGEEVIRNVQEIVLQNRSKALKGIDDNELEMADAVLRKIIANCKQQ